MRSMTGFGRGAGQDKAAGIGFRVDVSSINRKQFEAKFALPRELAPFENNLRMIVAEYVSRGSVLVRVDFLDGFMPAQSAFDPAFAKKVLQSAEQLAAECGMAGNVTIADVLGVPGVFRESETDMGSDEAAGQLLEQVAKEALTKLRESRETEGARLAKDINRHLDVLKESLEKIIPHTVNQPKMQYEKLLARLKEYNLPVAADDERLLRELVIFADKADVTEEITRLHSHFALFDSLIADKSGEPVGRQLDFLTQEVFREINTLGNKAACAEVSPVIVNMKTSLEKIREQVQNIE